MGSPLPTSVWAISNKSILLDNNFRYVDHIFVVAKNEEHLITLKERMEAGSLINFTYKTSINGKIPFLDVCIKAQNGQLVSVVFRKQAYDGKLLNAISECPGIYKSSLLISSNCRAHICSTSELFNRKIKRFKQLLVSNEYTNTEFEY